MENLTIHSALFPATGILLNISEYRVFRRPGPAELSFADKLTLGLAAFVLMGLFPGFYMMVMAFRRFRRNSYVEVVAADGEIILV